MKEKIAKLLTEINEDITEYENIDLINEGLLDSLEIFELMYTLEDEFNIQIDGKDVVPENFVNINTILRLVEKSLSSKGE